MHLCLPHQRSGTKHNHLSQPPWGLWNLSASLPTSSCLQGLYSHLPQGAEITQNLLLVGMWSLWPRFYFLLPSNMPQLIHPLAKLWADLLWASLLSQFYFCLMSPPKHLLRVYARFWEAGRWSGWDAIIIIQCNTPNWTHHTKRNILIVTQAKQIWQRASEVNLANWNSICSVRTWYRWQGSERYLAGHCYY